MKKTRPKNRSLIM